MTLICESERHSANPPTAVAVIRLAALPEHQGYSVCPECLVAYCRDVYLDASSDLRLAFTVEPTP